MTADEFQGRVRDALRPHSTAIVAVLRQLVAHEYPAQVATLAFEVFPDGFTTGFPVRAFFVDETNTEFFSVKDGEHRYPSPVDPGLLDLPRVYDLELEDQLVAVEPESDPWDLAGRALVSWFADRWQEAGGAHFSRSANIALHDDPQTFDLVARDWVSR